MKNTQSKQEKEYYECSRCNSDSSSQPIWVPCVRDDCEAKLVGKKVIIVKIIYNAKKEIKK
jgi:hypothetical protein